MSIPQRNRSRLLLGLAVLVVLGLGSRRSGMPDFVVLYAGDVLWGAFFFMLGAFLWPSVTSLRLWLGAVVVTELIEASQAWRAQWLVALRATKLGGLLLGHEFLWSDVVCVALGATLAFIVDILLVRARPARSRPRASEDDAASRLRHPRVR